MNKTKTKYMQYHFGNNQNKDNVVTIYRTWSIQKWYSNPGYINTKKELEIENALIND